MKLQLGWWVTSVHAPMEKDSAAFGDQQAEMAGTLAGGNMRFALRKPPSPIFHREDMGSGETILIVDDEKNLRTTLSTILQRAGYNVIAASSFNKALQYLKERCFDLVFLDLKAPEPDEVNLLREINTIQPGVPVILLTATAYNEAAAQLEGAGTVAYLLKPIDPARIVACAEEVLKKSQRIEQPARPTRQAHTASGEKAIL